MVQPLLKFISADEELASHGSQVNPLLRFLNLGDRLSFEQLFGGWPRRAGRYELEVVQFILKIFLDFLHENGEVVEDLVWSVLRFITLEIVTEDDSLTIKYCIFSNREFFLCLSENQFFKHFLVILVDHTISKHSLILMEPELQKLGLVCDSLLMS